jgi:hypothetical protein
MMFSGNPEASAHQKQEFEAVLRIPKAGLHPSGTDAKPLRGSS